MNNGDTASSKSKGRGMRIQDEPRELRRPHTQQVHQPLEISKEPTKHTLSAEAKEWYPANYVPPSANIYTQSYDEYVPVRMGRVSVQDRLRINQTPDVYSMDDLTNSLSNDPEDEHLKESITNLINVMCEVTFCPGKFDTLCGPLVDTFASTLHDEHFTHPLVDAIVNQSIGEPNFRYNGARLCSMYDSIASPGESTFRSCLLERCQAEEDKILHGRETSEENMRGFAMFLAEIYTQLEDTQGGRIRSLGESLCKILLHLLDTHDPTNIKTVCQLLKLSGIALDADCPNGMHAAFERLRAQQHLPLVNNIIQLRANRWGVQEPTLARPVSNGSITGGDGSPSGGDSIFLADGHALTAEERAFLQSHLPSNQQIDDPDEYEQEWVPGMDAEMQAGFLEFLKLSNQIKR